MRWKCEDCDTGGRFPQYYIIHSGRWLYLCDECFLSRLDAGEEAQLVVKERILS